MFYTNGVELYTGDMRVGDREATQEEIDSYLTKLNRIELQAKAQIELDKTDSVALRCWKANLSFPTEWQSYTLALRAIVNGTDTSSTELPIKPPYIANT